MKKLVCINFEKCKNNNESKHCKAHKYNDGCDIKCWSDNFSTCIEITKEALVKLVIKELK